MLKLDRGRMHRSMTFGKQQFPFVEKHSNENMSRGAWRQARVRVEAEYLFNLCLLQLKYNIPWQ